MPKRPRKRPATHNTDVSDAPVETTVDRRMVAASAIAVSLASLTLYLLTMAPGLTWENTGGDGGDFLAAAFTWGVPHPTGYPTYIVLLRLFAEALPFGAEAFRGNLFSAVTGAGAVGLFFGATWRLAAFTGHGTFGRTHLTVTIFASASFATGNLLWSQATITEVYALGALFAAALLWLAINALIAIRDNVTPRWTLTVGAFVFGLSLGNHMTIGLFVAPLVALLLYELRRRFGWQRALDWRPALGLAAGLSIYVYAPIASSQDPPLNWFMPHTADGFWQMISASIYRDYVFGTRPGFVPSRVLASIDLWLTQYSVPGAVLGLAGLSVLWERQRQFAIASLASAFLIVGYAIVYYSFDPYVYLVPAFMLFAAWMAIGLYSLLDSTAELVRRSRGSPAMVRAHATFIVTFAALLLVPVWSVAFNYRHVDLSDDRVADEYVRSAFTTAGAGSVIVAEDVRLFSLWYQEMVAEPGADVAIVALHLLPYDWYWEHLQRRYPDRIPSGPASQSWNGRMVTIIEHNRTRNVFFTAEGPYNENWVLLPDGPLLKVSNNP